MLSGISQTGNTILYELTCMWKSIEKHKQKTEFRDRTDWRLPELHVGWAKWMKRVKGANFRLQNKSVLGI